MTLCRNIEFSFPLLRQNCLRDFVNSENNYLIGADLMVLGKPNSTSLGSLFNPFRTAMFHNYMEHGLST